MYFNVEMVTVTGKQLCKEMYSVIENGRTTGFTQHNFQLLSVVNQVMRLTIHATSKGGLTPEEIATRLHVSEQYVLDVLSEPPIAPIVVGSIVQPAVYGVYLRSGGALYSAAEVVSVEPFVLVSLDKTMTWKGHRLQDFEIAAS